MEEIQRPFKRQLMPSSAPLFTGSCAEALYAKTHKIITTKVGRSNVATLRCAADVFLGTLVLTFWFSMTSDAS